LAEYEQNFISPPGERNGLYWDAAEGEEPSPLGSLVADKDVGPVQERRAYRGYYFKILTRQGPHATGGKYNYISTAI
jgi:hypothetical protein